MRKRNRRADPVAGRGNPPHPADTPTPPARGASVIWHEVECGGYAADLRLWVELAERRDPLLELGCGTGRVLSHLVERGHDVSGLDLDPQLIARLEGASCGDARDFDLDRRFDLILAPMQLIQVLAGPAERGRCLRCVAAHLAVPGGLAAFAIVESVPEPDHAATPLPDTREVDGWVYSSLPVDSEVADGRIRVRRLRQTVSPDGELSEELHDVELRALDAATLEAEAADAGLRPLERRRIADTDAHLGSTVVLLEREA